MPVHQTRPSLMRAGLPRTDINRAIRMHASGSSVADLAQFFMTTEACVQSHIDFAAKKAAPQEKPKKTTKKKAAKTED